MVRTQIQLTPQQAEAIKREAAERGASMAEIIRICIDDHLRGTRKPSREEVRQRALSIVGIADGGPTDLAERHDDYLAEAFER